MTDDHTAAAARAQPAAPWWDRGLCVGRAALFASPPGHEGNLSEGQQLAINFCAACDVLLRCTFAVLRLPELEDWGGIVAGLTEEQRAELRRRFTRKRCPRCRRTKPGTAFSPNLAVSHGLHTYCRPCEAARARERAARKLSTARQQLQGAV